MVNLTDIFEYKYQKQNQVQHVYYSTKSSYT